MPIRLPTEETFAELGEDLFLELTDEELENLRLACMMQGARNVSEFARAAVVELAGGRSQPESVLLDRFSAIELKLAEIEGNVRQNGDMLRALLKDAIAHHDRPGTGSPNRLGRATP